MGQGADFAEIKKAYFRRAKLCHPDLFGGDRSKEEEFKRVVGAFDILSDPDKRLQYDQSRQAEETGEEAEGEASGPLSVMDSEADDTLEELIVGNIPPLGTTMATLFLDLAKTEVFMCFREGKTLFRDRRFAPAEQLFRRCVAIAPGNILYRCFLARSSFALRNYKAAVANYQAALELGGKRTPRQRLERPRAELELAKRKRHPWWANVAAFFAKPDERLYIPEDELMIDETNKAMAKLLREERKQPRQLDQ